MISYYFLGFGAGTAVLVALYLRRKRAVKAAKKKVAQKAAPVIDPRKPGNGTPLFHGVRVVELATVVAAPTASRCMAELGAEVVKIEEPGGDPWRKWFLQYEPGRPYGTSWESANIQKQSVVLDLKSGQGMADLKKLLEQADVFVTNVRRDALDRLGLAYSDLAPQFPHLIYAHLSAYGRTGPGAKLPGYDIGAFWSNTGLCGLIHDEGRYSGYPVAYGDISTGYNLLTGISMALTQRLGSGRGCLVSTALLRTGLWCMSPHLVHETPGAATTVPNYDKETIKNRSLDPLSHNYRMACGTWITLGHVPPPTSDASREWPSLIGPLAETLHDAHVVGDKEAEQHRQSALRGIAAAAQEKNRVAAAAHLATLFATLDADQVSGALSSADMDWLSVRSFGEVVGTDFESEIRWKHANCHVKVPGLNDLPHFVSIPFELHCSEEHGPKHRGPLLGEHTEHYLRHGFYPLHPDAVIKRSEAAAWSVEDAAKMTPPPLDKVIVVELCGYGQCAAGVTAQLADFGATVYKLELATGGGCGWRQRDPQLFAQLNRGKQSVALDDDPSRSKEVRTVIEKLLKRADLFITNWSESSLAAASLDPESVRSRHPRIVYTLITPWGRGAFASSTEQKLFEESPDQAAYWAGSGLAAYLTPPKAPKFTSQPLMLGELQSSLLCACGVAAALFHQRRTGEGQLVDFNLLRAGHVGISQIYGLTALDRSKQKLFMTPGEKRRNYFPVPTANCYRTKDGVWVQMLGAALPVWLPKFIRAFGLYSLYPRIIFAALNQFAFHRQKSLFQKLFPVFEILNVTFTERIAQFTLEELEAFCDRHGLWYTRVNMAMQARDYPQAHACEAFRLCTETKNSFVTSPVHLHGKPGPKLLSDLSGSGPVKVPKLNENDL